MGIDAAKTVLLIEDSPGDVRLAREAFRAADGALRLHVAVHDNCDLATPAKFDTFDSFVGSIRKVRLRLAACDHLGVPHVGLRAQGGLA